MVPSNVPQNINVSTHKTIKLMWVPLHIGIIDNEFTNELAMKAVKSPNTKIYSYVIREDIIHSLVS